MSSNLQPTYGYYYTEQLTLTDADRLTGWTINNTAYTADYSGNGNIVRKSDFGLYAYGISKPHAVSGISSLIAGTGTERTCEAEYNTIGKVSKLTLKNGSTTLKTATFTYAADGQRRKMQIGNAITIYVDNYQVNKNGNTEQRLHYISGPAGLCALIVQNYNGSTLTSRATYYLQTDYQGSIIAAYYSGGTLYRSFAYDPWGSRRAGNNWTNYQPEPETLITRGYCGHEHLDDFGTINMNGRIYDPRLGRFLSPDPYVQAPYNSQNYNRYSYCLNNPLKYTDPSGDFFWIPFAIGAIIGGYTGYKIADAKGYDMGDWQTYGYMVGGAVIGGFSGVLGAEIATAGGFMANTSAMVFSSYSYSIGMAAMSGGMIQPSVNFGFGSYNFGTGEFNYLLDGNNKWYEDLGYGLGAIANFSDIMKGFHTNEILGQTENLTDVNEKDQIGHYQLTDKDGNSLVDFGPGKGGDFYKFKSGRNNWTEYATNGSITQTKDLPGNIFNTPQVIKGVNLNILQKYSNWLNSKPGFYNFALRSCSTQAARGLTLSGVPVFGIHPYLLRFQIANGLRLYMFNYTYTNEY